MPRSRGGSARQDFIAAMQTYRQHLEQRQADVAGDLDEGWLSQDEHDAMQAALATEIEQVDDLIQRFSEGGLGKWLTS